MSPDPNKGGRCDIGKNGALHQAWPGGHWEAAALDHGQLHFGYRMASHEIALRLQDAIFTIALEQSIMSELRGMEICPEFIDFQHLPMSENEANDYRAFFDCDVRFGRNQNAIAFPAASLSEARSCVDSRSGERLEADLVNSIQSKAKHIELSISIEAWMTAALSAGESIDLERAAGDLG